MMELHMSKLVQLTSIPMLEELQGASRVPFTIFIFFQGTHHLLHTVIQDVLHLREGEEEEGQKTI